MEAFPIETFCAWQEAKEEAANSGIPFHCAWLDFNAFLADLGPCPEEAHLEYQSEFFGFIPSNCHWSGLHDFPETFAECPVSLGLLKAGLIDEADALRFAYLDADPEFVRSSVAELNRKTEGQDQETRRAAVSVLLNQLVQSYGLTPRGFPNRWLIRQATRRFRAEALERKVGEVEA